MTYVRATDGVRIHYQVTGRPGAPPILFVQGLPPGTTEAMLGLLFEQFPGYVEARLVPARPGIAFVEFGSPGQAGAARAGLDGFKVTGEHSMVVSFAKQ